MTQEEKELLLKDLCVRLPYGVKCKIALYKTAFNVLGIVEDKVKLDSPVYDEGDDWWEVTEVKPYLRPISSMTEEEKEELLNLLFDKEAKHFYINGEGLIDGKTLSLMKEGLNYPAFCPINITLYTDWLNARHFDYHGLIEKDLAIEAPEGMYDN